MKRKYLQFIQESMTTAGYTFFEIDHGLIYQVVKDSKAFIMYQIDVGLNNATSFRASRSKAGTYQIMNFARISAVRHDLLVNPGHHSLSLYKEHTPNVMQEALNTFSSFGGKAVIKQDDGSAGSNVILVQNEQELIAGCEELFAAGHNIAISPFFDAPLEYRVVVLDGQVKLVFAKERVSSWRHNLTGGGAQVKEDIDTETLVHLEPLAVAAAKQIGLTFCAIDILHTASNELLVLEINSTFALEKFIEHNDLRKAKVAQLYKEAFELRFSTMPQDIDPFAMPLTI
ncbi:ATP-grasp domain-containing protein [Bacillus salinus]|uniref:ATP-grasp domain-containing protein n=1 Tax=Bacillus sp. HMF5848 TaxID=2495421 RepID=UPI00163A529A|nr:hypothetical protein [Bacillus sp. HMF5848]